MAALDATGRRTAVLVGPETDVCVTHSALGLLDRGYRVAVVVDDATYSPGDMHDARPAADRRGRCEIVHAKGVYYEWLRTLDAAAALRGATTRISRSHPGFSL